MARASDRSDLQGMPKTSLCRVYLSIALAAVVVSLCLGYVYWVGNEMVARLDPQDKLVPHLQRSLIGVCLLTTLLAGAMLATLLACQMRGHQTLKAANQQLEAWNEQLRATNQQLEASEQQMRAASQQLRAQEQHLQAVNQQLTASEQQAREERDRAEHYFNLAGTMLVVLGRDGRVERINRKGCEVLAAHESDIVGKDWFEHFLPEPMRTPVRNVFEQIVAGHVHSMEFSENPVQTKAGEQRLVAWHNTVLQDEIGQTVGILSSGEDITERKQAEQELRTFKHAVESSSDAIGMSTPEGRHIYQNHTFDALFGDIGNDPPATLYVDPNIGRQVFATIMRGNEWASEVDMYRKDGEILNILLRAYPVKVEGSIVALVGMHTNITERKRATEALEKERSLIVRLVETSPVGILMTNAAGQIQFANSPAEQILGLAKNEITGRTYNDPRWRITNYEGNPIPDEHLPYSQVLDKRQPVYGMRHAIEWPDGRHTLLSINATPLLDQEGQFTGMVSSVEDVTEHVQAEKKVLQYQDQLRALVSQLTLSEERERKHLAVELHDGICQSLAMAKLKVDEQLENHFLPAIHDLLQEMQETLVSIINDTRSLTNNLGTPMLQQMGLHVAIEKWLDTEISAKHGIRTQVIDEGVPKALNDNTKALLFRAVRELAINVVKHAEARTLTVTLKTRENQLHLAIVDDGKGFDCPALTEQDFSQGGYGLFSIQERITYIGGDMTIDSSPRKGTRIVLRLPLRNVG